MKKVLFVGLNPFATAGNSAMMYAILSQLDKTRYSASCFAVDPPTVEWSSMLYNPLPYSIIAANDGSYPLSFPKLYQVMMAGGHDAVVFVGVDLWEYLEVLKSLVKVPNKPFKLAAIFPYDLQHIRHDWIQWINWLDFPCVYSKYGENMLKDFVPRIRYFRPPLKNAEIWQPENNFTRNAVRQKLYPYLKPGDLVLGCVALNQTRKDLQGLIKAFAIAHKDNPNLYLFLQTDFHNEYNLIQAAKDYGLPSNAILKKPDNQKYLSASMPRLYNSFDMFINCSLQEGLSWTPLEAMLCGVPVIASRSTAHIELIEGAGITVPCDQDTLLKVITESGPAYVDAKKCDPKNIADAIGILAKDEDLRKFYAIKGFERALSWLDGVNDINDLLDDVCVKETIEIRKEAVLFMQHSSAGDVLMTTRCFKGIKGRYGLPLHYMTSEKYMDIVTNNPYIDKVIPWVDNMGSQYRFVVNPHGERIAPGHWGRNSNSLLSDFYWKILDIEPDDFFIELQDPGFELDAPNPICVLHTTGGDPRFRVYKFMKDVADGLKDKYTTVQLGGADDYPAWADVDLRGKLSFRETAWVMSKASIAVTVDSFISHLAGALGVSQVCLFGSGNHNVVRPNQVKGRLICMVPNYITGCPGLGPCSASVRDCPATCTGRHNPKDILKAIEEIEK
jgi:glycosyltransferase involved in cell wall biosynthesis/ADP-heptose:LPS heptosyltransferase